MTFVVRRVAGEIDAEAIGSQPPLQRSHLNPEKFAALYGADPADLAAVEHFAASQGLEVIESSAAERSVVVTGSREYVARAFGVQIEDHEEDGVRFYAPTAPVVVPEELAGIVVGVFGLDNRPAWKRGVATDSTSSP